MFTKEKLSPRTQSLLIDVYIVDELETGFFKLKNGFVVTITNNQGIDFANLLEEKIIRFSSYEVTRPFFLYEYWQKLTDTLTKEHLESLVEKAEYYHFANKASVCKMTLEGGFCVYGTSGVLNPLNFDKEIGEKYAYENAFNQIWELEGYVFQQVLDYRINGLRP